ncbi:branched-chain amino acid ABC transporter permease [Rhodoferax sp.]|uniref:branched-chain amino acid ABC transporter permease n=1 Tax=Rhodoferax sp. TaxID=50421 RepID=UPI002615EB50|nr:branched-chain amino acid ABC transporter permease [Rhodoferax sp.]MDD2926218.1 branched-chain amino acid ABC transporter permease [Rhodoferax sp.]
MSSQSHHFKWFSVQRVLVWVLFALVLLVLPMLFSSRFSQTMLNQIGIAIIVCLSYNILLGQGGMLSFGHALYAGLGSFFSVHTLNLVSGGWPVPVSLIPIIGGVCGALVALLLGWVTTKKSGTPFAMITFGIGELVWAMSLMIPEFFGGEGGISGNRVAGPKTLGITFGPQIQLYYLIAAYTFGCTVLMYAFTRTPLGQMLNAVRDNPERVEFVGYDTQKIRYFAFIVAAFFAGISGGLAALNYEIVTSEVISGSRSGAYMLFTFLGGAGAFFGPIIGAVLMVLASVLLSEYTEAWFLYLGLTFLLMVMYAPGGVAALISKNLHVFRLGGLRQLWVNYLALLFAGLAAVAGASALIEMSYHLLLHAEAGSQKHFLGWVLDVRAMVSWLGALLAMFLGISLFRWFQKDFTQKWDAIQSETARGQHQEQTL